MKAAVVDVVFPQERWKEIESLASMAGCTEQQIIRAAVVQFAERYKRQIRNEAQGRSQSSREALRSIERELRLMKDGYKNYEFTLKVHEKGTGRYYVLVEDDEKRK